MLERHLRFGRELVVRPLVARDGAEEVAVQAPDQIGERPATRGVEARFADVLRGRLGWMELDRLSGAEVEHHGHEAVRHRPGVAPRAGERALTLPEVAGMLEPQSPNGA